MAGNDRVLDEVRVHQLVVDIALPTHGDRDYHYQRKVNLKQNGEMKERTGCSSYNEGWPFGDYFPVLSRGTKCTFSEATTAQISTPIPVGRVADASESFARPFMTNTSALGSAVCGTILRSGSEAA